MNDFEHFTDLVRLGTVFKSMRWNYEFWSRTKNLFKNSCWFMYERLMSIMMLKGVPYYRVSTKKQGKSRLGLDAQKDAVKTYTRLYNTEIIREYFEIESGRKKIRPELKKALRYCRKTGAILIIANIDRLARNALLVASLIESKVRFVAANKPYAEPLDHLEDACKAEREGIVISQRTKLALREAKKRGVELGKNGKALAAYNKQASIDFRQRMLPVLEGIKGEGFSTLEAITKELNRRHIPTFRNGAKWHRSTVHSMLK